MTVSDLRLIVTVIKSGVSTVDCRFIAQPSEVIRTIIDSPLLAKTQPRRSGYRSSATKMMGGQRRKNFRVDGHYFLAEFAIRKPDTNGKSLRRHRATGEVDRGRKEAAGG